MTSPIQFPTDVLTNVSNETFPVSTNQTTSVALVGDKQIDTLGLRNANLASEVTKKIIGGIRASDTDTLGDKLNELVTTAKGMDPTKLGSGGVLSKLTNLFGKTKEKMMAQYDTVEGRMNALVDEIDKSTTLMVKRIDDLELMFKENENAYNLIGQDIEQGRQWVASLQVRIDEQSKVVGDALSAQRVSDLQSQLNRLEKVIDDLERGQHLCVMAAPEIRMMQNNARALASSFRTIKTTTVPAWQGVFSRYILSLEQKKGAEIATAVYDATDEAFKRQADQLRQNTNQIAQLQQRSVVSTETLIHMQQQLLGSVDDVLKIEADGRKTRTEARVKLQQFEQELVARFTSKP